MFFYLLNYPLYEGTIRIQVAVSMATRAIDLIIGLSPFGGVFRKASTIAVSYSGSPAQLIEYSRGCPFSRSGVVE